MKSKQFIISLLLFGFGIYLLYSSIEISLVSESSGGILLGQGGILIFWGIREGIESILSIRKKGRKI